MPKDNYYQPSKTNNQQPINLAREDYNYNYNQTAIEDVLVST